MNRILALAAVAVIGAFGVFLWTNSQPQAPGLTLGAVSAQESSAEIDMSMVADMRIGNPDATVTVIEYASFTCPHCRSFHEGPFKELKADYIDTGRINFVYREVYFDRFGLWAGMLARCGGEERYFALVDLIYENQRDWTAGGDPAVVADNLRRLGRTAGFAEEEVNACLSDSEKAQALVAVYQENAAADGINSTPSFVINGRKYANMSYADFSAILDEELGS
ncbi:MAG: DsbA family protein [Alphaproteobacteria bacterium]|nr:DsbA family protein [Alphaproteobacteria bacterium]